MRGKVAKSVTGTPSPLKSVKILVSKNLDLRIRSDPDQDQRARES